MQTSIKEIEKDKIVVTYEKSLGNWKLKRKNILLQTYFQIHIHCIIIYHFNKSKLFDRYKLFCPKARWIINKKNSHF